MKVVLTEDVYKHGVAGEVVNVADGFARNYLIPQGFAVKATAGSLKQTAKIRDTAVARKAALDNKLNELAREIDGTELIFGRRAGANGKLYGSVTTMEITEALLEATGVDINRRRISQQGLRELGEYDILVRLGSEQAPYLKVIVVREEDMEDFLAARNAPPEEEEAAPELAGDAIVEAIAEADASTEALEVAAPSEEDVEVVEATESAEQDPEAE